MLIVTQRALDVTRMSAWTCGIKDALIEYTTFCSFSN